MKGMTPLFRAFKVIDPWFLPPRFEPFHPAMAGPAPEDRAGGSADRPDPTFGPVMFRGD